MKLLDNGFHSFKKSIKSLNNLEINNTYINDEYEYEIKEIIISLHHSIETLFKHIIREESKFLLYDRLEDVFDKELNKIIDPNKKNNKELHTISFMDAVTRVIVLKDIKISNAKYNLFETLNEYRNSLTHYEFDMKNKDIEHLLANIIPIVYNILSTQINEFSQFARINDLESNVSDINKNELIWKLSRYYDLLDKVNKADDKLKEYDNNKGLINQFYENHKKNKDNIYEICPYCNKKGVFKKINTVIIGLSEKAYSGKCEYCNFELNKEEALFILNEFFDGQTYKNRHEYYILDELENIISIDDLKDEEIREKINQLYISYSDKVQATLIKILENKIEVLCEEFSERYFEQNISGDVEYGEVMLIDGSVDINLYSYDVDITDDEELIKYINNINILTRGDIEFIDRVAYDNEFEYELIYPDANNDNEDVYGTCNVHINFELDRDCFDLELIEDLEDDDIE